MKPLKSITLEISLKPFRSAELQEIEAVCYSLFDAWRPLIKHADRVCVLLWTADGSEILDYSGRDEDEIEWCRYIGGANPLMDWDKENDPEGKGLHTRWYLYTENPPVFTNADLRNIVTTLKRVGTQVTGKKILVGETFDPGPEFAKSDFKYKRHNEICIGESMGRKSMVCCYAVLNRDDHSYATYPDGIPDDTPFGTFFGRQAQRFLTDMGFDYLWLSNGFGFGTETWGVTGAIFDGSKFYPERMEATQERIMEFWRLFRKEFHLPVETRGTNLTAGIDFATDAVNLKRIYESGFDILPPPNSPWAAMDGNFGLELAGYMSRMAELPSGRSNGKTPDSYLYRFYLHDPWWMNSPWMDRYERQPYDIYLPLATVKLNSEGKVVMPDHINFLTVDNSLGEMPESCVNEVIPHLLQSFETAPDEPSPFVWVYPFDEYHRNPDRISKAFFEEWFFISAINASLPVNTVISSHNFVSITELRLEFLLKSVLVVPVPDPDSSLNASLLRFVERGGRVMLYGSVNNADEDLLNALNIRLADPVTGEMTIRVEMQEDQLLHSCYPDRLVYGNELSDGGVDTVVDQMHPYTRVLARVCSMNTDSERVILTSTKRPEWNGGGMVWCRGYSCSRAETDTDMYPLGRLFTLSARVFGYDFRLVKQNEQSKNPVISLHRNRHSVWISGYNPDTTNDLHLSTPLGAPLLQGFETVLSDGCSVYRLPRAWRNECRVFVQQEDDGVLGCRERAPVSYLQRHKLEVNGLKNATVYILPQDGIFERTEILCNSQYPFLVGEPIEIEKVDTVFGNAYCIRNVIGNLQISDLVTVNE